MNIKRFTAPTSREALAKARMAFGDGTLILSNRPTANGVEVVATAEDTLSALDGGGAGNTSSAPLLAPSHWPSIRHWVFSRPGSRNCNGIFLSWPRGWRMPSTTQMNLKFSLPSGP